MNRKQLRLYLLKQNNQWALIIGVRILTVYLNVFNIIQNRENIYLYLVCKWQKQCLVYSPLHTLEFVSCRWHFPIHFCGAVSFPKCSQASVERTVCISQLRYAAKHSSKWSNITFINLYFTSVGFTAACQNSSVCFEASVVVVSVL